MDHALMDMRKEYNLMIDREKIKKEFTAIGETIILL